MVCPTLLRFFIGEHFTFQNKLYFVSPYPYELLQWPHFIPQFWVPPYYGVDILNPVTRARRFYFKTHSSTVIHMCHNSKCDIFEYFHVLSFSKVQPFTLFWKVLIPFLKIQQNNTLFSFGFLASTIKTAWKKDSRPLPNSARKCSHISR